MPKVETAASPLGRFGCYPASFVITCTSTSMVLWRDLRRIETVYCP